MSSRKKPDFPNLLTFRLALYFVILFLVSAAVVLASAYLIFSPGLMRDLDGYLASEADEVAAYHRQYGTDKTRALIHTEAEAHGVRVAFIQIFNQQGRVIAASEDTHWPGLAEIPPRLSLAPDQSVFETISLPGREGRVRLINHMFGPDFLVRIAYEIRFDNLTARFGRILIFALGAMILVGGFLGWLIVRRAMSGVARVTEAARRIGQGDFDQPLLQGKNEGLEIDRLAGAFNDMARRIQTLVNELQAVTTDIAHDLRSPVNRIRGLTEMTLTQGGSASDWRETGGEVIEECDRLAGLIDTILEIAQANSGHLRLPDKKVNLSALAQDAVELFQPMAEDKGLTLELELDPAVEPVTVQGDISLLQRVVANLLDNSIKFTPPQGKVSLSVTGGPEAGVIRLADTGAGIPPENLDRIFDRFFRGDLARSTPGNGLGLSLVQALVRAHGGVIKVESAPGRGSVFTVKLPTG